MKKYEVDIYFERESFNGYSYIDHVIFNIESRNLKYAESKATKKFYKEYRGFCIRNCIIKEK